jgi:L-threonylcarbamoyladenylate synthase
VSVTQDAVDDAVRTLRLGGLVAFPTETVYGLGADASNAAALHRLYAVKGRPVDHPVIVHLPIGPTVDATVGRWGAALPPTARTLAEACWPGPLTLVLPRGPAVLDEVTGGADTVGLRVPDQPVARRLLTAFGGGVAAPSANRFGRVSPTTAAHVHADLDGDVDLVLDGGPCHVGVESTIVDCSDDTPIVLRLGALSRERLRTILGFLPPVRDDGSRAAPGTRPSHYAPRAEVVVCDAHDVAARVRTLLKSGRRVGVLAAAPPAGLPSEVARLAAPADVDAFAHQLFSLLRRADDDGLDALVVVPPPATGVGAAVLDRLTRAAAARTPERTA